MRAKGFTLIELLIVVAIIAILAAIAVPNFLEAQIRSKVARVKADQRSLATAIESYYIDEQSYPAVDSSNQQADSGFGANSGVTGGGTSLSHQPTFRRKQNAVDALRTLTTPISYITSYMSDPFSSTNNAGFSYSSEPAGTTGGTVGWILWSFGPDNDENDGGDVPFSNRGGENTRITTSFYNPTQTVPSPALIGAAYDSTNGTTSNGDVYRFKQ